MKRSMGKCLALIMALTMLFSLAACSSGGKEPKKDDTQPTNTGGDTAKGDEGEAPDTAGDSGLTYDGDEVTITYWHTHGDAEEKVLKEEIVPEFEKQFPKIHVKLVRMPYDGLKQQIIQGVSSGTAPDLMRMDIIWISEFAKMGALVPVDDLPGFAELKDQFFEGPLSTNYYDGKYYGVPLNTNCLGGCWSKTLLDQLQISELPTTYDEVLALKDKLGEGQYLFSAEGANTWALAPLFYSLGGHYTNEDFTKATGYMNSDASVKALETIVKWYDEGILGPATMGGKPDVANGLFRGNYLFSYQGPWFYTNNKEEDIAKVQSGMLPAGDGGSVTVVGGEDLCMFSSGKNQEASWVFARFLLGEFAQKAQALGGGRLIPTIKEYANSEEVMAVENMDVYVQQLETAVSRTPHPNWEKMSDKLNKLFESCLRHEAEPKAALDKLAGEADALLAE
jgi:multiple sugar transport system substrate-binding protein